MRNDAGINGDAQRIEQIVWMLFLKVYDAKEQDWEKSLICFSLMCLVMMGVVPMTKAEIQTMYEVMFTDYPDIVNVAQVQSMLNISRHLAYSLINDGYIPGIKIGNAYRVPKVNVINYALSAGNSGPAA